MEDLSAKFNTIVNEIPQTSDICLFPLRLETRFHYENTQKQLRVRIIPDEIFLDYHRKALNSDNVEESILNSDEAKDGKRFWIRWYIASGSKCREYEAWLNLCEKYPVAHAAWICRCLKPQKIEKYKKRTQKDGKDGEFFDHRPFPRISEIEDSCKTIYEKLGKLPINEKDLKVSEIRSLDQSQESSFEKNVKDICREILNQMYEICKNLRQTTIVDYLYDSVIEMATHLKRRLDSISKIYDEYPSLKNDIGFDKTKDLDYWALNDLKNVVDEFLRNYKAEYRVSLSDMVEQYLERMDTCDESGINRFFPNYGVNDKKRFFEIPEASFLPKQFCFVGEGVNSRGYPKLFTAYSKEILRDKIKLSIDPDCASSYSVGSDGLKVDESVKWMFDYKAAEDAGMAITVSIPDIVKFKYIYVFGVKEANDKQNDLSNLFNGHNYFGSSLELLDPRVSTNIIDGELTANPEELEKRIRYEIEVNDKFVLPKGSSSDVNDAKVLSDCLNLEYDKCFGHVINYDSEREKKTKKAYEILWKKVRPDNKLYDTIYLNIIGYFFINFVRATGNVSSIKIGDIPYGILPITVYEQLYGAMYAYQYKEYRMLLGDLLLLSNKWQNLQATNLPSLKGVGAEKNYLKMAGQTPYSVSFVTRDEIQSVLIEKNKPTLKDEKYELSILKEFLQSGCSANQAISNSDCIYNIENSVLVEELMANDFAKEDAINYATEFIDLFTYRLDAWLNGMLAFFMKDRISLGVKQSQTRIGAYGWVFDLKEKESNKLNDDRDHFVIAPSIQHALSAAVLRSAYLKSKSSENDTHVCVNLSSMRVRQALRLVDGIRSGMSMSVVLGCDLERYLHDAPEDLDYLILSLRQLFPQIVNIEAKDERAEDYTMQVINGEALLETIINHEDWNWSLSVHDWLEKHLNDEKMAWIPALGLNTAGSNNNRKAFFYIIERMMDSYDALNDLLLSEGVHRLVMGDQASFNAIGNFLANKEGGLPDPEILKTPSEHVVVSHKAGVVLPQTLPASNKPFSLAEPGIDAWVNWLIGGMDKICFYVKRTEDKETFIEPCSLKYVNVSASEYLYLSAFPATFTNYLETRWRLKTGDYTSDISIMENGDDATVSCTSDQLSLEEDAFRIQTIRNLLKKSHGMCASDWIADIHPNKGDDDFSQSDKTDEDLIDLSDLSKRGTILLEKAKGLLSVLNHWLYQTSVVDSESGMFIYGGEFDDKKVSEAYKNLCDCVEFGLANCFTGFDTNSYAGQFDKILEFKEHDHSVQVQEELFHMVQSAKEELEKRINEFTASVGSSENEMMMSGSEKIVGAIQNLTLKNIKIFPKFKIDFENFESSIAEKDLNDYVKAGLGNFKNVNLDSFERWQDEVAEVREGMKDIHNLTMAQTALDKMSMSVSILQTTTRLDGNANSQSPELILLGKDWLGMPVDDESKLRDVDSLVLYNADKYESGKSNSGFVFDGWLEYIPYKKHNAGLVFHCDRPDAEAPQTVLLAVLPKACHSNYTWCLNNFKDILDTTSKMMKYRAIEPDDIYNDSELSRIFPLFGNKFLNQENNK